MQRSTRHIRPPKRMIPVTTMNCQSGIIYEEEAIQRFGGLIIALKIVAMQQRQKLSRLSNYKYCLYMIERSIIEN